MRLIDADALIISENECATTVCRNCKMQVNGCEDFYIIIENAPTIESDRKKGKWSTKEGELAFWDVYSECGRMIMHRAPFYNFCPNCGADMRGGEKE